MPPPGDSANKSKAVAGLVCGIIGILFAWWGWLGIIGIAAGIVGLIFSIGARKDNHADTQSIATGGLVCSIIALVASSVILVGCVACTACYSAVANEIAGGGFGSGWEWYV